MANTQYLGTNAGFNYTSASTNVLSSEFTQTYKLAVPLREVRAGLRIRQYVAESLDFTARQVFTVSSGVYEFVGSIRYADDQQQTIDFLKYGVQGVPMIYSTANTTGSTAGTQLYMIEPTGDIVDTLLDRQRTDFEDLEMTIRLRRTDGGSFSTMFR